jgi:uncharacterized protein
VNGRADLARVSAYAIARLENELDPQLVYHSASHTRDEVVPAAGHLAALEGLDAESTALVLTGAWFHDLGFIEEMVGHEEISARIAAEVLPDLGYGPSQVQAVQGMILATRLPQSPKTPLEEIVADADLMILGSEHFRDRNGQLRKELTSYGRTFTDEEWFRGQAKFLGQHRYFTAGARAWLDEQKRANLEWMQAALARLEPAVTAAE